MRSSIIEASENLEITMQPFPLCWQSFVGGEIVDMLSKHRRGRQVVLLTLLAFSLISWAIILTKWSLLRRAKVAERTLCARLPQSAAAAGYCRGRRSVSPQPAGRRIRGRLFEEYKRQLNRTGGILRSLLAVQRGMQIGASEEITRLERNVPWLAITAAVTPFIGLFGTVWGIIDAFHGLGTAGAATLRAVAPGHLGSADHYGCRTGRRDSGRDRLQPDRQLDPRIRGAQRRFCSGSNERGGAACRFNPWLRVRR
jgi:biopolymer transport protein ExbB/TolQ